jgi:hypothetical protein
MSEERGEPRDLSPGADALLAEWLRRQDALRLPSVPAPEVEELVGYLSGALSGDAARGLESRLVADPDSRLRLRQARTALDELQALPWAEAARMGEGEDFGAEVARAWLRLAARQVSGVSRMREWWLSNGWSHLRRQASEAGGEAQAALAALRVFGDRLRAGLEGPSVAIARGGAGTPEVVGSLPSGLALALREAEVTGGGSLNVALEVVDPSGEPNGGASGTAVELALTRAGEAWPVARGVVQGARVAWELSGLAGFLGLPPGALAPESLRITVGVVEQAAASGSRRPVLADAQGGRPALVELEGEQRWSGGQLSLTVSIPAETRAAYPTRRLAVDLLVSTRGRQRLGAWPLSEWGDKPRTITAACPGSPDAAADVLSILRVSLEGPE